MSPWKLVSNGRWLLAAALLVACAKKPEDPNAVPACDAPAAQEAAREAASQSYRVPFTLSSFNEVAGESTELSRACRVRAKHAASGAAIWLRFTLTRRAKESEKEPAEQALAVVFAPIE